MNKSFTCLLSFILVTGAIVFQTSGQTAKPCIFCEIANENKQESQVVYRDKSVVAFMSHGPRNPGHVLVIPKAHAKEIVDVPDSTARQMMSVARRIAVAIRKTDLKCEGFQFQINSGEAAGQTVFHSHLHVMPRYAGDEENKGKGASGEELDAVAKKIREVMNSK
jgi:histidine triad (HIT) family protein